MNYKVMFLRLRSHCQVGKLSLGDVVNLSDELTRMQ